MRRKKQLAAPFVITATALSTFGAAGACGGQSEGASSTGGAAGTGGAGGTGSGTGTGASGGTTGNGGTGGAGGSTACPTAPPKTWSYGASCATAGLTCTYDVTCHGGPDKSTYTCDGKLWSLTPANCINPEDECSDGKHCSGGKWYPDQDPNYNPPGPCPLAAPPHGSACQPGGFGGDPSACGYPCDLEGGKGWTVASCDYAPDGGAATWQLSACN